MEALGKIGDERVVAPLIQMTSDSNDEFRQQLAVALIALGKRFEIIGQLLERLQSTNAYARKAAVYLLGELADARGFAPVCKALDDPDAIVRSAAAFALGKFPNSDATLILAETQSSDPDQNVRNAAAFSRMKLLLRHRHLGSSNIFVIPTDRSYEDSPSIRLKDLAEIDFLGDKMRKFTPPQKDNGMIAG